MAEPKGSLRHVRWYVNEAQDQLDAALFTGSPSLAAAASGQPDWVSPLESDGYLECWNERFLERLDILEQLPEFSAFWPFKTQSGGVVKEPVHRIGMPLPASPWPATAAPFLALSWSRRRRTAASC